MKNIRRARRGRYLSWRSILSRIEKTMEGAVTTHPRQVAAATPDRPALIMAESGEVLSYGALVRRADQAANLFASLGIQAGDTIALFLENNIRYAELCWAAKNSGLYYVCISSQLNTDDLDYIVTNCDAKLLMTSYALRERAAAVAARLSGDIRLLMIDGVVEPFRSYEALVESQPAEPLPDRNRGASMLYSSGTTGRPKGVRMPLEPVPPTVPPRRQSFLNDRFKFAGDAVFVNPGPLCHAAPLRMMMATQRLGGTTISFAKFDPAGVLEAIARYRATHGFFVPTMFVRLLRLPDAVKAAADVSSMRYAVHGAAPCPPAVKEAMIDWWGLVIHELYGGTEGMGHTSIAPAEWLKHKGSVGRPAAGAVLRILDPEGRELGPNQTGLVYFANGNRFSYYKEPGKTASAYGPEGLATFGDIGHVDEEGYLYLTDRQAHMIISGGVNIYPQEAENVLITHPRVADVAVIGIPDEDFGEQVKAVIELEDPADHPQALAEELLAYCRSKLSSIKCPRSIDFVDALPRNHMGKLLKRELRARYWQGRSSLIL
jgi:acyl-CoA synthetase (AMP-forming)/AMP-acid ligase II